LLEAFSKDNHIISDDCFVSATGVSLYSVAFSQYDVGKQLRALKTSKTICSDGLSAYTLKNMGASICLPLSLLFEFLFMHCHVPMDCRTSIVSPLHKNGSRVSALYYRPISITSIKLSVV